MTAQDPVLPGELESELQKAVERRLSSSLDQRDSPSNLAESIRYSLLAPGKRIRPRLSLATARMVGLASSAALPAGLAIEMIHCFTLIHDDLPCMDDDDFRRGMPSNHRRFGEGLALLAGDALVPMAVETYLEAAPHVSAEALMAGLKRLLAALGPLGVIGGQAAEMLLTPASGFADLSAVFAGKTGALFSASLLVPKDLAGIADDSAEGIAIDLFARELGLAFQIADDLDDPEQAEPGPTHILHYLKRPEAEKLIRARLLPACDTLTSVFGPGASTLVGMGHEVLARVDQNAAPSP